MNTPDRREGSVDGFRARLGTFLEAHRPSGTLDESEAVLVFKGRAGDAENEAIMHVFEELTDGVACEVRFVTGEREELDEDKLSEREVKDILARADDAFKYNFAGKEALDPNRRLYVGEGDLGRLTPNGGTLEDVLRERLRVLYMGHHKIEQLKPAHRGYLSLMFRDAVLHL